MVDKEILCYRHLVHLGVPTEMRGYKYLKAAIMLCLQNGEYIYSTTKKLYPEIASQYATTPAAVERSIRHAIEHVCRSTPRKVLKEYFGNILNVQGDKLTNRRFIAGLVEYIKMEVER